MASVGTALPHPSSTTQAVPRVRGPGLAVPASVAGGTMIGPAAVAARRDGRGSLRDCLNTRHRGAGVLLAGDTSGCETCLL